MPIPQAYSSCSYNSKLECAGFSYIEEVEVTNFFYSYTAPIGDYEFLGNGSHWAASRTVAGTVKELVLIAFFDPSIDHLG